MPNKHYGVLHTHHVSERSHSTHTQLIPSKLHLARGEDFTHTLENFGLDCSIYGYSIIFEKHYLQVFFMLYEG